MAIDDDLVDLDEVDVADPEMPEDIDNSGALLEPLLIGKGSFYCVSESGVWGDPSDVTAERDEECFATITDAVAELINTIHDVRGDIYKRQRPDHAQEQW